MFWARPYWTKQHILPQKKIADRLQVKEDQAHLCAIIGKVKSTWPPIDERPKGNIVSRNCIEFLLKSRQTTTMHASGMDSQSLENFSPPKGLSVSSPGQNTWIFVFLCFVPSVVEFENHTVVGGDFVMVHQALS